MALLLDAWYNKLDTIRPAFSRPECILADKPKRVDVSWLRVPYDCSFCNLHKGTNLASIDPQTGEVVPLFNPRTDAWEEHFALVGAEIIGQTPIGRATVRLLQMNSERRIILRKRLLAAGEM
jgi:hypothetical protein